jgi:glyoxylase-like metal-dependent hydrolase (beta-lactamase superfamily II)
MIASGRARMEASEYALASVESAPFGQLAYVAWRAGRSEAVVVDPGFDAKSLLELLEQEGLRAAAILNTHGHLDHIAGNGALKQAFPDAPLIIGRNEETLLTDPRANMSAMYGFSLQSPSADRLVADGEQFEVAGFTFEVREIPGHSPGSVVYVARQFTPAIVFGGDVLMAGSVGRTDLGGDAPLLFSGIRAKLFDLPDDTVVFPGHGPATTVGAERRTNPFVGENAGLYRLGPK